MDSLNITKSLKRRPKEEIDLSVRRSLGRREGRRWGHYSDDLSHSSPSSDANCGTGRVSAAVRLPLTVRVHRDARLAAGRVRLGFCKRIP